MSAHSSVSESIEPLLDALREEGRQEILREIAAMPDISNGSIDDRGICLFCQCDIAPFGEPHKPDCLWLRAHAAVAPSAPRA